MIIIDLQGQPMDERTKQFAHSRLGDLILEDPAMPNNEIHFRDSTGKIVGKIVNIGVASEAQEEGERLF